VISINTHPIFLSLFFSQTLSLFVDVPMVVRYLSHAADEMVVGK